MSDIRPGQWVISVWEDDPDRQPYMVMEVNKPEPGATWETTLVFFKVPGGCLYTDIASNYRLATWEEVAAAGLYVPPEVDAYEALCAVARVRRGSTVTCENDSVPEMVLASVLAGVDGAVGFLPVFDTYIKALEAADGDATNIVTLMTKEVSDE